MWAFRNQYNDTTLEPELASVRSYYAPARAFIESLSDGALAATVVMPWTQWVEQQLGRTPGPTTVGETILQVLTHSTHHRAQVNMRLRALGVEPPMIDYIAWLRLERPQPEWPTLSAGA